MKISLLPKSRLGTWSAGLCIFSLIVCTSLYIFAESLKVISSHMLITVVGATSVIAQIIAFFIGIIAIMKDKERSSLVFLSILLGLVLLGFILGDISGLISD